jgi:hypothetical protein
MDNSTIMKSKTLDYINIWLLIISFVIAIYLPFELFLFSYAILGPLHYLTEINWLADKKYFLKSKSQGYKVFLIIALFIAAYPLLKYFNGADYFKDLINVLSAQKNIILLSGFVFSVSLIFFTKLKQLIGALVFSILFSIACNFYIPKFVLVLGIFLPTLIHVYIFTLLFMVYGQLKAKSQPGKISILLLTIAPLIIGFLDVNPTSYFISDFTDSTYSRSGFLSVNSTIARVFGEVNDNFSLVSVIGIKIQIFIAFAYTYHYLNWFSKTSIIGWKNSLTSTRMKYIIVLWICSVGLYFYNYLIGLTALFFLSMLHVVLEFPLNLTTIKELALAFINKYLSNARIN